jgi:hypothetical protein
MTKIQYKKVVSIDFSEQELNLLGADGWDNYSIVNNAYFFKRPIADGMIPTDVVARATDKKHEPKNRK